MTNWVIVILIIAAVCVYDLCGLLAVLYINHTDRMGTVDGADNVIVLIFWAAAGRNPHRHCDLSNS